MCTFGGISREMWKQSHHLSVDSGAISPLNMLAIQYHVMHQQSPSVDIVRRESRGPLFSWWSHEPLWTTRGAPGGHRWKSQTPVRPQHKPPGQLAGERGHKGKQSQKLPIVGKKKGWKTLMRTRPKHLVTQHLTHTPIENWVWESSSY